MGRPWRRKWKVSMMIAMALVLVACGSGGPSAGGGDNKQVEIFSWWTGAGEEAGLHALIELFQEKASRH